MGFDLFLFFCTSGCSLVQSSPYRLHAGLIHLSMDLLYRSASCFLFTCLPRARSEIHSLLFALLSPLFLPQFLDIYPSNPTDLFFVLYHLPLMVRFLMDFRVLTTLTPSFLFLYFSRVSFLLLVF